MKKHPMSYLNNNLSATDFQKSTGVLHDLLKNKTLL